MENKRKNGVNIKNINRGKYSKRNKNVSENINEKVSKKISLHGIIDSYLKFYNENIKFKHVIVTIVMIIFFVIILNFDLTNMQNMGSKAAKEILVSDTLFKSIVKEKIPLSALVIFAGITPFVFLPVIGTIYGYILAFKLGCIYIASGSKLKLIFGIIGAIIQIIGMGISVATGIYYCIQSTKRFRYNQRKGFGFKDVKKYLYQIINNEKKLEELKNKEKEKNLKMKKLNVKIEYVNILISFIFSVLFLVVGTLLTYLVI